MKCKSPSFSDFRHLMDLWDEAQAKGKVDDLMNGKLIFFFEKEGSIFGGTESSRVTFAKMKNPDDEMPKGWQEEAAFGAINLSKILKDDDESQESLFMHKDLKSINVLDRDEAKKKLK